MKSKIFARLLSIAFLSLAFALSVEAQQTQRDVASLNYGFVSPNTREDLKLDEAIRGMYSAEETNLLKHVRNLGCVVKRKIGTRRALGSWSDGAEHSIMLRVKTNELTIRYLMSRLGKDANQKAVIYFHPDARGSAKIYSIVLPRRSPDFASIAASLDKSGIAFRTLIPTKQNTTVYVVDTENNLAPKVRTAAKRLSGRVTSQTGNASFIGDDADRAKGQVIFTKEITDYESKHPGLPPPCVTN